jgi:hypothetical protein
MRTPTQLLGRRIEAGSPEDLRWRELVPKAPSAMQMQNDAKRYVDETVKSEIARAVGGVIDQMNTLLEEQDETISDLEKRLLKLEKNPTKKKGVSKKTTGK